MDGKYKLPFFAGARDKFWSQQPWTISDNIKLAEKF
jgi:hypothetical protein